MLIFENFYLGACFFCAMDATDLLWISVTVNVSAALFFLSRALIGRLAARWRDAIEDKSVWRSVVDKHEDEPWRFPRFCIDVVQSAAMTIAGFTILCVDDVIHHPFRGTFSNITKIGFAIAIGCYIYRTFQDSILHTKVKHFKVDLVHHLVTIAVYGVFLTYRENALFGAIGLICTGSVPSVEMTRLLKVVSEASGKPTTLMGSYRWNLLIGAAITFVVRLVIPLILGTFAIVTTSPLTMSIPVVAFFFTSLMFFGSINLWLCGMAILAIHRRKRRYMKDVYVSALDGQSRKTFPTTHAQQATILAKQNPIKSRLTTPCANVNLTPSIQTLTKMSNNHSLPNNYVKVPVNEALVLPFRDSFRYQRGRSSEESSQSGSNRNSGELMVVEGTVDRQRAVRFIVPRSTSSRDSVTSLTSATTASPNNGGSPQPVARRMDQTPSGRTRASSSITDADPTTVSPATIVTSTNTRPLPAPTSTPSQLSRGNPIPSPMLTLSTSTELNRKERTPITQSSSSTRRMHAHRPTQANMSLDNQTTVALSSSRLSSRPNLESVNDEVQDRRNSTPSSRSQILNTMNNLNGPNTVLSGHNTGNG
eukprot:XP_003729373.1 PREDICTED: uncharacterized protein LOC100891224 [Strongylocentrotus purpuratus]